MEAFFADVILPIPIPQQFTYQIPEALIGEIGIGKRVVVPFGRKKFYSGIVTHLHRNKPVGYETKEIVTVLDTHAVVTDLQLTFWYWMAEYYQCSIGEVYKAALPSGLKLESETKVFHNVSFDQELHLKEKELLVLNYISSNKECSIADIQTHCDINQPYTILNKLIDIGVVSTHEQMKGGYQPKLRNDVSLSPEFASEELLKSLFAKLGKSPKQLEALMFFISVVGYQQALQQKAIDKALLTKLSNPINELIKKGYLTQIKVEVGRLDNSDLTIEDANELSAVQVEAFKWIKNSFTEKETVLLHGVTSSGKTEIYIHLIEEQLSTGKQVLYLLPEIALTTQITSRLKKHFGNKLGIYHSKYSEAERVEVWQNILQNKGYQIILGARSSIFLPYSNLGLIIVDEEHETSYKQFDPSPRYHARDAALVLAHYHKAKTLLGTATPSIESYYNAQTGKYGLVNLLTRHQDIQMPEILVANTREAKRKKQMRSHFSPELMEHISKTIENKEQVILFQNRRGFSPYIECNECATIPRCKNCDVSMTYHKHNNTLICHYCSFSYSTPNACAACGSPAMETKGFGTQKIEEEIKLFFPDVKVSRMDIDTAKTRNAHEKILSEFEKEHIQILIGTQMISKGLDFNNVSLVGILDADTMLNYPDFRAFERGFQMMSQVSGRAGRKNKRGTVILQTNDPSHVVIQQVVNNDFGLMYQQQLDERQAFKYPPFYRLININIKHKDINLINKAARNLALALRHVFGDRVLGPQPPLIGRIQTLHIIQIMIKVERQASPSKTKEYIQTCIHSLVAQSEYRSLIIQIDVDPM